MLSISGSHPGGYSTMDKLKWYQEYITVWELLLYLVAWNAGEWLWQVVNNG